MTVEYQQIVRCNCGESRVYADYDSPVSEESVKSDILKQGWKLIGDFHYICPQCQRERKTCENIQRNPMLPEDREAWLIKQGCIIKQAFLDKYRAGQVEHKGDLGEISAMQLLNEMEAEALDQLAYVRELKRRLILPPYE